MSTTNGKAPTTKLPGQVEVVNNFFINHPQELIDRYRGQYVAWSMDGRTVLASAPSLRELFRVADECGLDPEGHVVGFVDSDM